MRSTISAVLVLLLTLGVTSCSVADAVYWIKEVSMPDDGSNPYYVKRINEAGQLIGRGAGRIDGGGFVYDGTGVHVFAFGTVSPRSDAADINESGQVVGFLATTGDFRGGNPPGYAFLYDASGLHNLGTLSGMNWSTANSINAAGQVVGASSVLNENGELNYSHAFLYSGGVLQDLGPLGPYSAPPSGVTLGPPSWNSSATGINASGRICGTSNGNFSGNHAFLYDGAGMHDLGAPPGSDSFAQGLNDAGQVFGYLHFRSDQAHPSERTHPFLWDSTGLHDLSTLGGDEGDALAMNASGRVVGSSTLQGMSGLHAFLYDGSAMRDLDPHGPTSLLGYSVAEAINAASQIVGKMEGHACLWEGGKAYDLNDLIPKGSGFELTDANAINDRGQIACLGTVDGQSAVRQVLILTPLSVALPPPPEAPSNLTIGTVGKTQLTLTWIDNSRSETSFSIERATSGAALSRIGSVDTNITSFTDTGLTPGITYAYRVRAINAGGASDPSNEVSATTLPAALTSFTLSPDSLTGSATAQGTVTLDFPAPAGGAVVSLVNPNKARLFLPASVTVPEGKTSAAFSVATQPVTELQALAIGAQYAGVSLTATLTLLPPVAVAAVTLNPNPVTAGRFCTGTVTLSAPAPSTGAVVSLESDATDVAQVPPGVKVAPGATSATFQVTTRPIITASQATITATLAGTKQSVTLQVVLPTEAPAGPSNLMVGDPTPTSLTLAWVDNSATATGFEIERRTADTSFSRIWELGADATKFTDVGVAPNTTYIYRVRALNSAGASTYSNEASANTRPVGLALLTLSPDALTGGDASTGTVTLNGPAPAGGAIVSLTSSDPLGARVPQTLLIPAGATWTRFTVASSVTADPTTFTISAHYEGAVQTATLAVLPSTTLGSAILAPLRAPGTRHIAVMRPSTHEWFLRQPDGSPSVIQWGGPDDLPVPADYFGAGQPQIAVLRPATHEWILRRLDGGAMSVQWGGLGDLPVPADYLGTGRAQIAVLRPSTHEWFIRRDDGSLLHFQFGGPEDVPVPADYFGVGRAQIAVYRPSTSEWFILTPQGGAARTQWGGWLDRPVPGDYLGEKKAQIAIYRPSTSEFFIRAGSGRLEHVQFGMRGDEPVSYDYGDSGKLQIGIYRPGMGEWFVQQESGGAAKVPWGGWGDVPVPGAFSPH